MDFDFVRFGKLYGFVEESNRIAAIHRRPAQYELEAHVALLGMPRVTVSVLEQFVYEIAAAPLRCRQGQDVRVGARIPPAGGPQVKLELWALLTAMSDGEDPYSLHCRYEALRPFMDGNGRSGRALWAWAMVKNGLDPFEAPFLQRFYYQALDAWRG